jgi:hypothetical protein
VTTPREALAGAGRFLAAVGAAAATYFQSLADIAQVFRALRPLAEHGWTVSTYGVMLAVEQHASAADAAHDLNRGSSLLEDAWSDPEVRRHVCSMVPFLYPPSTRAIGERRRELLMRASQRFSEGSHEEAVLLIYSQIDGLFQDRADLGEPGYARVYSRRPIADDADGLAMQFADLVRAGKSMIATHDAFFLIARDLIMQPVKRTTLDDGPSRHGVLHGRVLGYGTRLRAAQAFAFLAGAIEVLVASWDQLPLSKDERSMPFVQAPEGLRTILAAAWFSQVRSVYFATEATGGAEIIFLRQQGSPLAARIADLARPTSVEGPSTSEDV